MLVLLLAAAGLVTFVVLRNPWNHEPETLKQLHGLTEDEVIEKLGTPKSTDTFELGEGQDELRVELLNYYPPSNPANHKVKIKELRWYDGQYHIAVRFHQRNGKWYSLDSLKWHKSVVF
jgi:hypothetical protein